MKKKKGLCIFLSAAMIATSFVACGKTSIDYKNAVTVINNEGKVCVVMTDKDKIALKEKDGSLKTSVLSDKEIEKINKAKKEKSSSQYEKAKKNLKENQSKKSSDKKDEKNDDETTKATQGTTGANGLPSLDTEVKVEAEKKDLLPEGKEVTTKKNAELLKDSVIVKTIKTKKFTINANIISGGKKTPTTIAFNNKDFCAEVTYSPIKMRMMSQNGKMYLVFPAMKMYYETDEQIDESIMNFSEIDDNEQKYVKTTKVNGLTCEEYKAGESTTKYYFDSKGNWKRMESIEENGTMTAFEISSFSGTVDSNLFSLKGLNKMDDNALKAMAGSMGA
ncbi:MAG: hypothetical protein KBT46_08595 [Ruminococcus sp.]|nr:hypothetical protein [Candidatus Copronaster equi]